MERPYPALLTVAAVAASLALSAACTAVSLSKATTTPEAHPSAATQPLGASPVAVPPSPPPYSPEPPAPSRTASRAAEPTSGEAKAYPTLPPVADTSTPLRSVATPSPTGAPSAPAQTTAPAVPPPLASQQPPRTVWSWVDSPRELAAGIGAGVKAVPEGILLETGAGGFVSSGELESPVREASVPFNNAVLSWNADAPGGTTLRFDLRVRVGSEWSGWYPMGEWGSEGGRSVAGQADSVGRVDIDTLKLNAMASALQYRVRLSSQSQNVSPMLRQVSVVYADMRKGPAGPPVARPAAAVRDLDVPGFSQLEQDPTVALKICSPTSLAMVLQYWGVKKSVPEVYRGVQDRTTGIFGNWPLNTAYAGANGLNARVDRFYSIEQVEQEIAAGRPVVISVSYSAGEITGAATASTDGHLIVVRGFTPSGDVIVNDPVAPSGRSVRLVYRRDQLSRVWLRSGGIVYLISPR